MTTILQSISRLFLILSLLEFSGLSAVSQSPDSFNPTPSYWVSPVVVQTDGKIVFGGDFTSVGGQLRERIARVTASDTLDTTFANPNADNDLYALAIQPDGKILAGGDFTMLGGQTRTAVGRLNTNGTLDTSFNWLPSPGASYRVQSILVQPDRKIVVAGRVTTTPGGGPGITTGFNLRLNTNGTTDGSFSTASGVNGPVITMALQPDGKILLGGQFTSLRGSTCTNLGRLNTNGTLDTNFNASVGGAVSALVVQADGKILLAGDFNTVAGLPRTNLARLNSDGTPDLGFGPSGGNDSSFIYTLALQADGKILVGGIFTTLANASRIRIGRLNPNGSIDPTFNPGANLDVYGITIQPDGRTLVTGFFSQLGGQTRNYIGRLESTDAAIQSLNYSNNTLTWLRGGTSPEVWRTTFESSTNGSNWATLGDGTRIAGGWQLDAGALPPGGVVRARGYATGGGYNGSSWFAESRLPVSPQIITSDGLFGFDVNQLFGFTVNAPSGSEIVIEASTNVLQWSAVETNLANGLGLFYFQDSSFTLDSGRFYRARFR